MSADGLTVEVTAAESDDGWTLVIAVACAKMPFWAHVFQIMQPYTKTRSEWRALTDGTPGSKVDFGRDGTHEWIETVVLPNGGGKLMLFVAQPDGDFTAVAATFSVLHSVVAEALDKELTSAAERGFAFAPEN
jgi:hypothetical protein